MIRQGASHVYVAVNFYFSIVFGYDNVTMLIMLINLKQRKNKN